MRVAIVGSRDFPDLDCVQRFVRGIPEGNTIISGGARGVDRMASTTAIGCGLHVVEYRVLDRKDGWFMPEKWTFDPGDPEGWNLEGPIMRPDRTRPVAFRSFGQAAYDRNRYIVRDCEVLVAFWDGQSRGTRHAIDLAEAQGKKVELAGKDA